MHRNDPFTETGSGQAQEKLRAKGRFSQVTTSVAFAANGITAVPAIRMFGYFVAVLVMCDYLLVITWFPAVIVMHHQCSCAQRCERRCCCCLQPPVGEAAATQPPVAEEEREEQLQQQLPPQEQAAAQRQERWQQQQQQTRQQQEGDTKDEKEDGLRCVERLLGGPLHKVVTHSFVGPTLVLALGGLAVALGLIGATIERSSATMMLLEDSHICSQYQMKAPRFAASPGGNQELVSVNLVYGVEAVDTGDHNDPNSDGEIALDSSFDLADPAAQAFLLGLGAATRALSVVDASWLTDLERFNAWLRAGSGGQCPGATSGLPLPRDEFSTCLQRWFDGSGQYNGCNGRDGCGSELRFADGEPVAWRTNFQTNIEVQDEWDYAKLKPLADEFESFLAAQHKEAPASAQHGFFSCGQWTVTDLQDNMVRSAVSSTALSVALTFAIILASTLNLAVAFYAIVTVIAIVACVMGCIVLMGWELGLLESMCMSILVGMSVDFVVHFAHAWVSDDGAGAAAAEGAEPGPGQPTGRRQELATRTHTSLSTVGISVLSAGVTTMVAAAVLFFGGVIVFFQKFGTMLLFAMAFSLVYSLLFFHALVAWLGPAGRCCSLKLGRDAEQPAGGSTQP